MFTHYVVAFNGAERTKAFEKAKEYDRFGHMVLLNEGQFFDILDGKADPPGKKEPPRREGTIIIPAKNPEADRRDHDRVTQYVVAKKRLKNMARYGAPIPGGGRMKADLFSSESIRQIVEMIADKTAETVIGDTGMFGRCDNCGKISRVTLSGNDGSVTADLCLDCYNLLMAEVTGTEIPAHLPRRLSFGNDDGEKRDFEIEFQIFSHCKTLTATEIRETKHKADVYGELDDDFNEMLETLTERIKKTLSVTYMQPDGYIAGDKAVGYIEYNQERDACDVIIDGKPYTWAELEKNISGRESFKIKIEFGDIGDELD